MLKGLNYRENTVLSRLENRIKNNLENLTTTEIDQVELYLLSMLLRDVWAIEEHLDDDIEEEPYLVRLNRGEKEAIYALMHSLEDARDTFSRPATILGMGESEIIKEILYSHFKQIEKRNLEQLEADIKKEKNTKE